MSKPKCRVLCVDDHHDTSEMLQMLLSEEDYEVHTAATMEEACRTGVEVEFDLYVLDKRLPDGTGVELCEDAATDHARRAVHLLHRRRVRGSPARSTRRPAPPHSSRNQISIALINDGPSTACQKRMRRQRE